MKKQILLFLFSLISVGSFSQITTNLSISRPSSTVSEWMSNNTTITYVVTNLMDVPQQFIIKAELKLIDGTVVASKDLSKAQIYTLDLLGTKVFFARDVVPLEIMIFTGSYSTTLQKTGKLPIGTYQLDVQLVSPVVFEPLTPVQSRVFNLSAPQLPYLMMPANNAVLDAKKAETIINFKWTALSPLSQEVPYYHIQVFEILPFQQLFYDLMKND